MQMFGFLKKSDRIDLEGRSPSLIRKVGKGSRIATASGSLISSFRIMGRIRSWSFAGCVLHSLANRLLHVVCCVCVYVCLFLCVSFLVLLLGGLPKRWNRSESSMRPGSLFGPLELQKGPHDRRSIWRAQPPTPGFARGAAPEAGGAMSPMKAAAKEFEAPKGPRWSAEESATDRKPTGLGSKSIRSFAKRGVSIEAGLHVSLRGWG